jgi:predicted nucleic acid-binding Zn ribbon protein
METKPSKKAKIEEKACLECGTKIIGRADKKFCSDQCRVSHNNRLNSNETNFMRNVNNVLRKNRRILIDLNTTGKSRVSREKLHEKGFDFGLFTSTYVTKEGSVYHYCYEQGYLQVDKNWYLLVVKKETI